MISYRRNAAWLVASLGFFAWHAFPSLLAASDVSGHVKSATGAALEGATVFVFTAAPKVSVSTLCPSCHPDCGKTARPDASGSFTFTGLSPELVFRLLVVAKGHAPKFIPGIEPGAPPLAVALEPQRNAETPNIQTARGRVVDSAGAPIHGAMIEIDGVALDGGRQRFGGLSDTDPIAITDENGEFLLTSGMPALALTGKVSARGFANQSVNLLTGKSHTLTLTKGATLRGRVMLNGTPLPQVTIGLRPQDGRAGSFVGNFEIGTDADGRFTLSHLPPKTDFHVYGKMETVGRHGSIPVRPVHVGRDGETTDLGDLPVLPALRLSGRVVVEDGGKLPEKSRLYVGRLQTSDALSVDLGPKGEFTIQGIPPGVVTLSPRVPGYKTSAKNRSYEAGNRRLVGILETDMMGLEILIDPRDPNEGPILAASLPRPKVGERAQDRPLRGIEAPQR